MAFNIKRQSSMPTAEKKKKGSTEITGNVKKSSMKTGGFFARYSIVDKETAFISSV